MQLSKEAMTEPPTCQPVIDKFWESIPPAWRQTRTQVRRIAFEKFQMSVEQFQVLRRIRRGSTSVSALAEASQTGLPAVSKAVESLVKRGLVQRSSDPLDRRMHDGRASLWVARPRAPVDPVRYRQQF